MSIDERNGGPSTRIREPEPFVDPAARGDRPIAPADPRGHELPADLRARIVELDAIAWNLPKPRETLLAPPGSSWPAED